MPQQLNYYRSATDIIEAILINVRIMKHEMNIYDTKKTWDTFKVLSIHSPRGTVENNILQLL